MFLQGSVDDPSLPDRLPIALFGDGEGGFRVAWRRPGRRAVIVAPEANGGDAGDADPTGGDNVPY